MPLYRIDEDAPEVSTQIGWIAPDAVLIGRVRVGARASVWWKSVLRADNERIDVGADSNVQDACVLHADPGYPLVVEDGVTVGHRVTLHGCRIERGALIGIGATILNGAKVGAGALVGAHALVTEHTEVPAGTLALGAPARVVRELTDEERDRLARSAARYIEKAAQYRQGLTEVSG